MRTSYPISRGVSVSKSSPVEIGPDGRPRVINPPLIPGMMMSPPSLTSSPKIGNDRYSAYVHRPTRLSYKQPHLGAPKRHHDDKIESQTRFEDLLIRKTIKNPAVNIHKINEMDLNPNSFIYKVMKYGLPKPIVTKRYL